MKSCLNLLKSIAVAASLAGLVIGCTETASQTGVEMEALTGVSVAALTLYDMCKAVDKKMRIEGVRVTEKTKQ